MTKTLLALMGIMSLSALLGTTTAGAASIRVNHWDYCLDPRGDSASGSPVILRHCGELQWDQQWRLHDGVIESQVNNNTCLDVQWGQMASGVPVQIYYCNGTAAQQWTYSRGALRSFDGTALCLDVPGAQFYSGAPVQIWECNGTNAQNWQIE